MMTEKEFRKLRTLDLIQILLTQGNEETRLQTELEKQKEHLAQLSEYNEELKTMLNDKDALIETLKQDLNQSDADIQNLRSELKELYTDKKINLENIGSLTEAAKRVSYIFETAQREAEEYLAHPERVSNIPEDSSLKDTTAVYELPAVIPSGADRITPEAEGFEPADEIMQNNTDDTTNVTEIMEHAVVHSTGEQSTSHTAKDSAVKKAPSNKNWIKKLIGHMRREK